MNETTIRIFPAPDNLIWGDYNVPELRTLTERQDKDLAASEYRLTIEPEKCELVYGDPDGRQCGLATWAQCQRQWKQGPARALTIEDRARFPVRGFMLDISRDRVPTRETLESLVSLLWELKYNQLQLYTEHTFAYAGHEKVWKNASPLTGDDVRWLDGLCQERGIELVPNQNCFGHFERWLQHTEYRELAESPGGFYHPHLGWRDHGSVLQPTESSAEFVAGLLEELVPNFRSKQINAGCDETWELGEGRSRDKATAMGKQALYLRHLRRIYQRVQDLGLRMQFWADIILKAPELISHVPEDAIPIIWGYEANHPFEHETRIVREAGYSYLIAPGTSTWNSFAGRWTNCLQNLASASRSGHLNGADGMLVTAWGDNGHHCPYAMHIPPIVAGAAALWHGNVENSEIADFMKSRFGLSASAWSATTTLMDIDAQLGVHLPNMSWPYFQALDDAMLLPKTGKVQVDAEKLRSSRENVQTALDALNEEDFFEDGLWRKDEVAFAGACLQWILDERIAGTRNSFPESLKNEYKQLWMRGSQPGGLEDSLAKLR